MKMNQIDGACCAQYMLFRHFAGHLYDKNVRIKRRNRVDINKVYVYTYLFSGIA